MPIYEFICKDCGNEFELLFKTQSIDEVSCQKCNSKRVEKKLSVFSVGDVQSDSGRARCNTAANNSCSSCCSKGMCPIS